MGVSKNSSTPKSSILIGFSIINHPFWGTTIFGNTHMLHVIFFGCDFILQEAGIDARFSEIGASIQETIEPGAFNRAVVGDDNGKDTEKP